jgi:hypothetical protein
MKENIMSVCRFMHLHGTEYSFRISKEIPSLPHGYWKCMFTRASPGPYPEPNKSSSYCHTTYLLQPFHYFLCTYSDITKVICSLQILQLKCCIHLSSQYPSMFCKKPFTWKWYDVVKVLLYLLRYSHKTDEMTHYQTVPIITGNLFDAFEWNSLNWKWTELRYFDSCRLI